MTELRSSSAWLSSTTSNQASVTSIIPVAAARAPTHGERRYAAIAVRMNSTARPVSKPDHARSQRVVSWCGLRDVESQIVHGSSPTPIAAKTATTQSRSAQSRNLIAAYTVANDHDRVRSRSRRPQPRAHAGPGGDEVRRLV